MVNYKFKSYSNSTISMKILVIAGLHNRTLNNLLKPLSENNEISCIYVVRDKPGMKLNNVVYRCPPRFSLRLALLKTMFKFLISIVIILKERIDYIHGFLLNPHGFLALILSKILRKRIVLSLIAGPVELFSLKKSSVGKYYYSLGYPKMNVLSKFLLYHIRSVDFITVTGSYTQNFLIQQGLSQEKVKIAKHIVDDVGCRFHPVEIKKEYNFVFIGRLVKVKRVDIMIMAINRVRKFHPRVKFVIVGEGKEKHNLENLVKKLQLNDNIKFVGYKEDVWNWYNKANYSLLMSEREGFPFSVIESMKCGIPVISSRCGDVIDIIDHNKNGILIERSNDEEQLSEELITILFENQNYSVLSKNAIKTVEMLSKDDNVNIWHTIFRK